MAPEKKRKTTVVNVYSEPCDVCCMRPSIYENKHRIGRDGTREEVIAKFLVDFKVRIKHDPIYRAAIEKLRGKTIGCCCKPKPCHGDIIAAWLNGERNSNERQNS